MNPIKNWSILLLLALLVFNSCKEDAPLDFSDDPSISSDGPVISKPAVYVNGSVGGTVMDQNGAYLSGVNIMINNNITQTDENGVFTFKNIDLNEKGALVTAELDGFYYNSKFVHPKKDEMSFTKMTMIQKTLTGSFSSATGGTIKTESNAGVQIPANAIKTETGEAYTGEIRVYSTWLDPTADDLHLIMPGDLRATDVNNEEVLLQTYGMIGVELEGENGEALNIADGKMATIELPVPNTLLGSAPATIPLWHFDEVTGLWVEEGEATLVDGKYVGEVGHFSFWNCDIPLPYITLSGRVLLEGGIPIENILITVTVDDEDNPMSANGYSDSDGYFSGYVPNDVPLIIEFFYDECNQTGSHSEDIAPQATDHNLGTTTIIPSSPVETLITGTLTCNGVDISNGYIKMDIEERRYILYPDVKGNFSKDIQTCNLATTNITISGYDLSNFSQSEPVSYEIATGSTTNLGDINVCELTLDDYTVVVIGNVEHFIVDQVVTSSYLDGFATVSIIDGQQLYNITFRVPTVSINEDLPVDYFGVLDAGTLQGNWCMSNNCANLTARFSEFSLNAGEMIKGHINGTLINENGNEVEVSFAVKTVVDY